MFIEVLLTIGVVSTGWYIAWHWKIKQMPFVRKLLELDIKQIDTKMDEENKK